MRQYTRQARHHQRVEAAAQTALNARIAAQNAVAAAASAGAEYIGRRLPELLRPRLPDFVPPFTHPHTRHVRYRDDRIEEPRTPPGQPESEEDDCVPNLEECHVIDEIGYEEEENETEPKPGSSQSNRIVKIRNVKTGKSRQADLRDLFRPDIAGINQLFRPEPSRPAKRRFL